MTRMGRWDERSFVSAPVIWPKPCHGAALGIFTCTCTRNLLCVIHARFHHGLSATAKQNMFPPSRWPPAGLPPRHKSHSLSMHPPRSGRSAVFLSLFSLLFLFLRNNFCLAADSVLPHASAWSHTLYSITSTKTSGGKVWLPVHATDQPRVHLHLAPAHGACIRLSEHRDALLLVCIPSRQLLRAWPNVKRGEWQQPCRASSSNLSVTAQHCIHLWLDRACKTLQSVNRTQSIDLHSSVTWYFVHNESHLGEVSLLRTIIMMKMFLQESSLLLPQ